MSQYEVIGLHTSDTYAFSLVAPDRWAWLGRTNEDQSTDRGVARAEAVVLTAHNALHEVIDNLGATEDQLLALNLALLMTNAVTNPLIRHGHTEVTNQEIGVIEWDLSHPRNFHKIIATSGFNIAANAIKLHPSDYEGRTSIFTGSLLTFIDMITKGNPINPKQFSLDEKGKLVHNSLSSKKK